MKWWPFAKQSLPEVRPGRESVPEETINGVLESLAGFYNFGSAPFDLRALEVLELLGMFNPDVSQALSIWVNLGNTGHELEVEARNAQAVLDRLNELAASVYQTGGGVDGLVNHFLRQIPLMGALSAEWVVADRVQDGLVDCVVVPVKRIRWQRVDGAWTPFQLTNTIIGGNMGYVRLNPVTYSCMPLITNDGSPYPIPPFLAAIKNLEVQLDATKNLSSIIRKMGLLGFIDVSLDIPDKKPAESDEAYLTRLTNRLQAYAKSYQKGVAQGVSVHYKDQEIKHNATNAGAAAGASTVWQMNEEQIFSALDIPPSMCGRSYSSTETYAAVDFERMGTKLANGRRMIKRFLEKGYSLDLLLRGIDARVSVQFNHGSTFRDKEKAEKEGLDIKNVLTKRDAGIIDTDVAAQELGYEKATGYRPGGASTVGVESGEAKRFGFNRITGRYEFKPERIVLLEQPADDRADQSYQAALESVLADCEATAVSAAIVKAMSFRHDQKKLTEQLAQEFAQAVYQSFAGTLRAAIAATSVMRIAKRFTTAEWNRYRYEDKNHLGAGAPASLKLDMTLVDKNALRYITNVEDFYFGRGNYLANDETTGKSFITWLQDEYITKGLNIRDEATWNEFKANFAKLVEQTSYQKIEQIVSTTMGRIQNMGQTLSLYEADVKRYRIVGPSTYPICDYCKAMLGRTFDVKVAAERLAKVMDKGFEKPDDLPPFLSSKYPVERVQEMTDEELQAAGFETPPFHPKCRHRKAAA
uniref:Phage portal protein n=1 Tax=Geobacter sp. (strain M21) TaxID=443144 RepID=C6E6R4_GEOSM